MSASESLQRRVNRIFVVLDGRVDEARGALEYAAGLSKLCVASLTAISLAGYPAVAFAQPSAPVSFGMGPPREVWDSTSRQAEAVLEKALSELRDLGVEAKGVVAEGVGGVHRAVARTASEGVDLIVVSRDDAHGFDRFLRRNAAIDLAKNANCAVVVTPPAPTTVSVEAS
jgi:nucleotide-binding universal stress UspA family protein